MTIGWDANVILDSPLIRKPADGETRVVVLVTDQDGRALLLDTENTAPGAPPALLPSGTARRFHAGRKLQFVALANAKVRSGNAIKVLLAILDFANGDTGVAWPSLQTLAGATRLTKAQIRPALRELETAGVLAVERSLGGYAGETHTFRPEWRMVDALAAETAEVKPDGKKRHLRKPLQNREGDPCENQKWTPSEIDRGPLLNSAPDPCERILLIHPSEEVPNELAREIARSPAPSFGFLRPEVVDGLWCIFEEAFPNRQAIDHARRLFCSKILNERVPAKDILDGVARNRKGIVISGIGATKWLAEGRWQDEPAVWPAKTTRV